MDFQDLRNKMVINQLRGRDVHQEDVLQIMGKIPREYFVPIGHESRAYEDRPLDIGFSQTISQPYMVAKTTELLRLEPGDKVLEVGSGSGYQAAILGGLSKSVVALETVEALAEASKIALEKCGVMNVRVVARDGKQGFVEEAPFDKVVFSCATSSVPKALIDQLKVGGLIVFPKIQESGDQVLVRGTKKQDGTLSLEYFFPVKYVPLV